MARPKTKLTDETRQPSYLSRPFLKGQYDNFFTHGMYQKMRLTYQILKVFKKGLFLCATKPKIQCKFRSTFWRESTSSLYFIEHKTIIRGFHSVHSVFVVLPVLRRFFTIQTLISFNLIILFSYRGPGIGERPALC